ncbi:hypothetical protein ACVMB1_005490 [Bradyrhizobium sp. USDA 4504]
MIKSFKDELTEAAFNGKAKKGFPRRSAQGSSP